MFRILKYLKPFIPMILLAVVLLFVQANADLSLPDYMANIVNYGIQQNGVTNAIPQAIRTSQFSRLVIFSSPADRAIINHGYTPVDKNSPNYATYLKQYPDLANEPIY